MWKAPAIQYPAHNEDEPYVIDARSYDETTYHQWNSLWLDAGGSRAQVDSAFTGFKPAQGNTKIAGQVLFAGNMTAHPRYHKQLVGITG